jgi:phosphate:Na+ symporter
MDEKEFGQVITASIALTHTTFNVANVIIFIPFVGFLAKFVTKLAPEKETKESAHLTYLDVRMLDTPSLGIIQSQGQINFMAESVEGIMEQLRTCILGQGTTKMEGKIFQREEILDNVQKEIFLFLSNMVAGQVPHEVTTKAHQQPTCSRGSGKWSRTICRWMALPRKSCCCFTTGWPTTSSRSMHI